MIRVAKMYVNFNSAVLLFSVEQDIHNPLLKNEINGAQGPSTKQTSGAERSVTLKIPSSSISAFVRDTPTYPLLPPFLLQNPLLTTISNCYIVCHPRGRQIAMPSVEPRHKRVQFLFHYILFTIFNIHLCSTENCVLFSHKLSGSEFTEMIFVEELKNTTWPPKGEVSFSEPVCLTGWGHTVYYT